MATDIGGPDGSEPGAGFVLLLCIHPLGLLLLEVVALAAGGGGGGGPNDLLSIVNMSLLIVLFFC